MTRAQLDGLGATDIRLFVGGTIPTQDYDYLKKYGVAAIFTAEMPLAEMVEVIERLLV